MSEKTTMTLTVNGEDITFVIGPEDYNSYINAMTPTNKVSPAHNFLVRTVAEEDKDKLMRLLKKPGAALLVVSNVLEDYMPDLTITVGKSSRSPEA